MHDWDDDQEWERQWWGDCTNTYSEETKQLTYAHRMGLVSRPDLKCWPLYNLEGRSVLDIGGGPTSMLLKTHNGGRRVVADPCAYPQWVHDRYTIAGIEYHKIAGEDLLEPSNRSALWPEGYQFDEVWIYNVLQHVQDPARIIANARTLGAQVRLFEWVDLPPHQGHPHELKAMTLSEWLGGYGVVEQLNENGCHARAFYGCFKGL